VGTVVSSDRDRSVAVFSDADTHQPLGLHEGEAVRAQ